MNQSDSKAFGSALRGLRERSGLTQTELATRSGIDRNHIGDLEQGEGDPKLSSMLKLADSLTVSFTALAREVERFLPSAFAASDIQDAVLIASSGILVVSPRGALNAVRAMDFFVRIFETARAHGTRKILLNVIDMHMDFSAIEKYRLSEELREWLSTHPFAPQLAVVALASSGVGIGAEMVKDHGITVEVFSRQPEALAWLEKLAG